MNSNVIVGIDLGTTNSVVAGMVDGQVEILHDDTGLTVPSVIGLDMDGKLITGITARNQLAAFPERTIASVKRKMGTDEAVVLADKEFTAQEISAMILRRLVDRAERALGQSVSRAVITVPAFFDENQRQATREAGVLAGLQVERIINEPTAATLVYHAGSDLEKQVVVYDFGGGTFDVSVVRFEHGVVEVLSSKGDTQLGGDDLDQLLLDHIADDFLNQHGIDLREQLTTRYRLLQACEVAKRELSQSVSVDISEEFIATKDGQALNLSVSVSRSEFERMIKPLIDRTIESVDAALRDASLTITDIDDLVLVGGSTRLPLVEQRLFEEFRRHPSRAVDPDLAVALGAATQAAMIDGVAVGPVLVDVTGHTLGIEVLEINIMNQQQLVSSPIIRRNSPLPAVFEDVYSRMHEDQDVANIHVLQGESQDVSRNRSIGHIPLDLDTGDASSDEINVKFALDLDGILKVTATQVATGRSEELVIDNALSAFADTDRHTARQRLTAMFDASDELIQPGESAVGPNVANDTASHAESTSEHIKKYPEAIALMQKCQELENIAAQDKEDIQTLSAQLYSAMSEHDQTQIKSLCDELEDILFYVES